MLPVTFFVKISDNINMVLDFGHGSCCKKPVSCGKRFPKIKYDNLIMSDSDLTRKGVIHYDNRTSDSNFYRKVNFQDG